MIRSLQEVEARQLHLAIGCSSMFDYCTRVLHLSEHAAYARIAVARKATDYPRILDLLVEGAITLTTVTLLGRHLTAENHVAVLEAARHKSKADVEMLVATLTPQPDVPSCLRRVPEWDLAAVVRPLASDRYTLQVTISAETHATLLRAQDLLRYTETGADEAAIIDRALTLLVRQLERAKYGRTDRPRVARLCDPASRQVPAAVRRAVSERDGDRCAFEGAARTTCTRRNAGLGRCLCARSMTAGDLV